MRTLASLACLGNLGPLQAGAAQDFGCLTRLVFVGGVVLKELLRLTACEQLHQLIIS